MKYLNDRSKYPSRKTLIAHEKNNNKNEEKIFEQTAHSCLHKIENNNCNNKCANQIKKIKIILSAIVIPILIFTFISVIYLYPSQTAFKKIDPVGRNAKVVDLQVISMNVKTCVNHSKLTPTQDLLKYAICARDSKTGEIVPVHVPKEIIKNGMNIGDKIKTIKTDSTKSLGTKYSFWDYNRQDVLIICVIIYLIAVVLVAKFKGLAAIFGLITSVLVLLFFVIPAILQGHNPIFVAVVGALLMIFLSVYLAHGVSIRTTIALLGTIFGLTTTVVLGFASVKMANLSGAIGEEVLQLYAYFKYLNLQQILICSIVISCLGALNDVTITQASAVWQIYFANPDLTVKDIFVKSMEVGKDHIASTVYTLAFAYVGSALTTILLVSLVDRNIFDLLNSYNIALEIVRTLISSLGIVLAIPLTTLFASILVKKTNFEILK